MAARTAFGLLCLPLAALALNNGLGLTPPMGYSTWVCWRVPFV